jgi:hypothetical protein
MKRRERKLGDDLGPMLDGDFYRYSMADGDTVIPSHVKRCLRDFVERAAKATISDGTNNWPGMNRPGWRMLRDENLRYDSADDKELAYCEYEDRKGTEYRDAANAVPNSTHPGWLRANEEQIPEGQACTCHNEMFPDHNGEPGTMKWFSGPTLLRSKQCDHLCCG